MEMVSLLIFYHSKHMLIGDDVRNSAEQRRYMENERWAFKKKSGCSFVEVNEY